MKNLTFRLIIAIITFIIGIAAATLWVVPQFQRKYGSLQEPPDLSAKPEPSITAAKSQLSPIAQCDSYIPDQFGERIGDFDIPFVIQDKLTYSEYEVLKVTKRVKAENIVGSTEIEYAILRKGGKTIATFGDKSIELSRVRFGSFSLLGGETKQIIVEQRANKYWRYWIVNPSLKFEVIYDSGKYDLVFDLRTIDLDGDGRLELVQGLGSFWYVLGDNLRSPRLPIILKYTLSADKYLPANQEFQAVVLKDIEQRIARAQEIKRNSGGTSCHAAVIDVTLRYLYAGKRQEAWAFFEQEYNEPRKEEYRATIKKTLNKDTVYKAIYKKGAT